MSTDAQDTQLKKADIYYGGIGALVGAGLGAFIGLLAANPELRKKVFESYTDFKVKGSEIYRDIEKMREARQKSKIKLLKGNND